MHGQSALEADWDKCNEVVPENVIQKSAREGLHETMQEELDLKADEYRLVSDERFNKYLYTNEHNKMQRRETQKRARDRLKSASSANDDSTDYRGRVPKKTRKEVKKFTQSEEIFFPFCKRYEIPYSKNSYHSDSSWNDAEYMKKFSGSISDRHTITKSFKKHEKSCKKELKSSHMKIDNFYKLASKYLKKSDLKRTNK